MSGELAPSVRLLLDAAADRIFPADDVHGPGAVAIGATAAVIRALEGSAAHLKAEVVAALESLGDGFPQQPAAEQDAALTVLAQVDPAGFETLRTLVLEGLFGDPSHGGNVDGVGWRMLGYAGPRHVVPAQAQRVREIT